MVYDDDTQQIICTLIEVWLSQEKCIIQIVPVCRDYL